MELMSEGQFEAAKLIRPREIKNERDIENLNRTRSAFEALLGRVNEYLPEGRYKSLVITHIETAALFATKAISHKPTSFSETKKNL